MSHGRGRSRLLVATAGLLVALSIDAARARVASQDRPAQAPTFRSAATSNVSPAR